MSAGGTKAGMMIFEMDLDRSKMEKGLQDQLKSVESKSQSIEQAWKSLGAKSDEYFEHTKAVAIRSYENIAQAGFKSAEEQARAMMVLASKVEAINAKQYITQANQSKAAAAQAAVPWETLGVRSTAAIKAQINAINSSYDVIKKSAGTSSQDLINIERAKNEQLKMLNAEMVGQHEMSMAAMTRAVLRFYAAYYVISSGIRVTFDFLMKGIQAIDDLKIATISVASQITTMQGPNNVTENFKQNVIYAEALNKQLMMVDANSFANLSQIQKMNMAMVNQGVILDTNKQKQVESFTALTNAVALFTQGQDKEKQASQEMRALFSGEVRAGNMVAMQMDALIRKQGDYKDGLKGLVAEGKKHGDTLERMQPYLVGIVAATGDIQQTWAAVSSSMETSWNIIQRGLFKDIYKDITASGNAFNNWLKTNQDEIVKQIRQGYDTIAFAVKATIGFFIAFAIAAWVSCKSSADAAAWFALRWEIMTARVTTATSKMLLGFNVFAAAILGFSIGTYLSNEFEYVRQAGVAMVYGIANAWNWFEEKLKVGWEWLKLGVAGSGVQDPKIIAQLQKETQQRINVIKAGYAEEAKERAKFGREQFNEVTDKYIKDKKAIEERLSKVKVPVVSAATDQLKESMRDQRDVLSAMKQENKAFYDEQIKDAEQAAKLAQRAGKDEFDVIKKLYDDKQTALKNYLVLQYEEAEEAVRIEAESAKNAQKQFDSAKVLQAKYDAIYAQYTKNWKKNEGERAIATEDAIHKMIAANAELYKNLGDYSEKGLDAEIEVIKEKYKEHGRFVKDKILLERSMNNEIFMLRNESEKKLLTMQVSYLKDMGKEYSKEYRDLNIMMLKNQADLLEQQFKNAAGGGNLSQEAIKQLAGESELTKGLADEYIKRLEDYATYLKGMGDIEGSKKAMKAAEEIANSKMKLQDKVTQNAVKNMQVQFDKAAWLAKKTAEFDNTTLQGKLQSISEITGSMSTFFDGMSKMYQEGTDDAKRWQEAAKAMEIAQRAIAVVQAVAAIATQGLGDPYTAFVRIAAMAAAMGALLATIGESVGGGGTSVAATQPAMGNSTVLGAAYGTGSESIKNSLDLLENTYDMENVKLTKIYNELRSLNNNITGLVSSILLTGGVSAFEGGAFNSESPYATNSLVTGISGMWGGNILNQMPSIPINKMLSGFKYFDPLAGSISLLPKIVETLFGGSTTTTIGQVGISIGKTIIENVMNGAQVSLQKYMLYATSTDGGWLGSSSTTYGYLYSNLDESVTRMFTKVFSNMGATLLYLATELGTDVADVYGYAFKATKINLMGKTGDEISEALTTYFSNIGDQAAKDLFGDIISQYQELNEGMLETAVRLVQDKIVVAAWLDITNQAFHSTISNTIKLTESLIHMAGGLEDLTDAMQTYYDAFFSDSEKQADLKKQLQAALGSYGMNLPGTRAGYRGLVESLNLTTEAGQAAYVALMQMSESADAYYDYIEKARGDIKESDYATRIEYLRAVRGYASGGEFRGGWRVVGEDGPELEYTGSSKILSNSDSRKSLGTDELVAEIKSLREEMGEANFNIAANSAKVARLLDQWDGNGIPSDRGF